MFLRHALFAGDRVIPPSMPLWLQHCCTDGFNVGCCSEAQLLGMNYSMEESHFQMLLINSCSTSSTNNKGLFKKKKKRNVLLSAILLVQYLCGISMLSMCDIHLSKTPGPLPWFWPPKRQHIPHPLMAAGAS